jgi:PAS domain S-box-containing protein
MQTNLELLKAIGWQALDLTPPDSADGWSAAASDRNVDPTGADVWTTLFDHAPCAIAIVDRAGRLTRVNRKFCTLVGFSPAEVTDRQLDDITGNFAANASETATLASYAEQFSCVAGERICAMSKHDGSLVWCRRIMVPCGDQHKQSHWAICYFDELRDSAEALHLLVQSHQQFVEHQSTRLETLGKELKNVGRLAGNLEREKVISLQREINLLLGRLEPLRANASSHDRSAVMIESAYQSASKLHRLVTAAAV